ncbi:glycoside hydrolase family 6 protein [Truncatella angustata]|uniref:Glucanase n=1 Tax=Truncatella angustata TaxID=152316 RepID=A0A9P8ZYM9_9PEZI|nr:glycoside hydrolase family 6 protein [Truncatella angustata]KAH6655193.1 glycoside hydrolase family 6 protein [Truncatella angustata]
MVTKALLIAALSSIVLAAPLEGSVEGRQSCASLYGQCGGIGWSGATCCSSGVCTIGNDYYSQCLPGSATTTSAGTSAGTTSRTSTSTAVSSTSTKVSSTSTKASTTTTAPVGSGTATWSGNPFSGVQQWANSYYASEVTAYAVPTLGAKAAAVAKVPSFMWLTLADIRAANLAGASPQNAAIFVVYDLPDRDCAAAASNGEYSIANNGIANYKNYIDTIVAIVKKYSDIRILLVVEPDSLANLVTNLSVAKCSNAQAAYLECVNYAVTKLNLPNVAMYLDAGHAGWLGWPANLSPAATLFAKVYTDAGSPAALRGLATNVANYNAWSVSSAPSYTQGNANYDESHYVAAIAPLLTAAGWNAHFITDTGRSGKQPTGQLAWGDWCNVIGTGFGTRPTAVTPSTLLDAFVWIKPGGECDGTSNTTATRYDYHCGLADALQPAPEAGSWFEAYFEQLFNNANPSFS